MTSHRVLFDGGHAAAATEDDQLSTHDCEPRR